MVRRNGSPPRRRRTRRASTRGRSRGRSRSVSPDEEGAEHAMRQPRDTQLGDLEALRAEQLDPATTDTPMPFSLAFAMAELGRTNPPLARAIMKTADTASAVEYMQQCLRLDEGSSEDFEAKRILASAWGKLSSDDRRDVENAFHLADGEREACMLSLAREDRRQRRKLEGGRARGSTEAAPDSAEDETMEPPQPTGEPCPERARNRRRSPSVPRMRAKGAQFLGKPNPYGGEGPCRAWNFFAPGSAKVVRTAP